MNKLKAKEAMIAWNPVNEEAWHGGEPGQVDVCKHPDNGQLRHLSNWMKFTNSQMCDYPKEKANIILEMMIEAWAIHCIYGLEPERIHKALLKVEEYCKIFEGLSFSWKKKQSTDLERGHDPDWRYRIRMNRYGEGPDLYDGDYANQKGALDALAIWKERYPQDDFQIEFLDTSIDPSFWASRKMHDEVLVWKENAV